MAGSLALDMVKGTLCLRDDGGCGVEAWTDVKYGDDDVFG